LFSSKKAKVPTIVLGNIALGGTGKTPHLIALLNHYQDLKKCAVVSRGYKRQLKGTFEVEAGHSSIEVGDEVFMMKSKFRKLPFYVGSSRHEAIDLLLTEYPDIELIFLDDAFQHRALKPHCSIVLNDYNDSYTSDHLFPAGGLRDLKSRLSKADALIHTKTSALEGLAKNEFSSNIQYAEPYNINMSQAKLKRWPEKMIAFCGLAKPEAFLNYVQSKSKQVQTKIFQDHFDFQWKDLEGIINADIKDWICTEKDAVKLEVYNKELKSLGIRLWVLPIAIEIHNFDGLIEVIDQKIQ
jgi:tetraacyldisaccharide 4'-kinase